MYQGQRSDGRKVQAKSIRVLSSGRNVAVTILLLVVFSSAGAWGALLLNGNYIQLPIDISTLKGRFMAEGNAQGAKYNPNGTGGASGYDFWVWGTPVYTYTIAVGGSTFKINGQSWVSGPTVTDNSTGTFNGATITGTPVAGLSFTRVIGFNDADTVIRIVDTLTNTGVSALTQVATLDNTDPDQGNVVGLGPVTLNDVVSVVNTNDLVLAATTSNVWTLGFGSLSPYRVADASGFENSNPYSIIAAPADPNGAAGDIGINLVLNYGTLNAGQTKSAVWFIDFGSSPTEVRNRFSAATGLATPSNPGAAAFGANTITWTWNENSSNETGFKVYDDPGAGPPATLQTTTAANIQSWQHTGLSPNTQYAFQVAATNSNGDSAKTANYTAWTWAAVPAAPVVSNPSVSTLDVAIGGVNGNPASTQYAIYCTTTSQWVQSGGALGTDPAWQTATAWGTKTVTGLATYTDYTFTVKARNGATTPVETAAGPGATLRTLGNLAPTVALVGANPQVIERCAAYTELGATVTDPEDGGPVTSPTVLTGGTWNINASAVDAQVAGSYTVSYSYTDSGNPSGNRLTSAVVTRTVNVVDTTPPVITLLGDNPAKVALGGTYDDADATAGDGCGPDLTGSIVPTNPVNTAVAGDYTVRYNVKDAANLSAPEVTRTVTVVPPPLAPQSPGAGGITSTGIQWTWSPPATGTVDGYKVYADPVTETQTTPTTLRTTTAADAVSWQQSGLAVNTQYVFHVTAFLTIGGEGVPSSPDIRAWTLAVPPVAPVLGGATETTLTVVVGSGDGNPVGTEYAIYCTTTSQWVKADGTFGAAAVWQTATSWGTRTVNGLTQYTSYAFTVTARNGEHTETAAGPGASLATPGNAAPAVALAGANPQVIERCAAYTELGASATDAEDGGPAAWPAVRTGGAWTINAGAVNVQVAGNYTVSYSYTDSGSTSGIRRTGTAARTVNVVDTTLPVIVRLGSNPVTVLRGAAYTDAGATASDGCGPSLTPQIVRVNPVNTAVPGDYTVRYNVKDASNNSAQEVTRTVTVMPTPLAPQSPGTGDITTTSIVWTWSPPGDGLRDGYKVYIDPVTNPYRVPTTLQATTAADAVSWQYDGLTPNTQYIFHVTSFLTTNGEGAPSSPDIRAWTLALPPLPPVLGGATATSLNVSIDTGDGNPANTGYAIYCDTTGQWVQANGTLGEDAVYQTPAGWGTRSVTGLAPNRHYTFTVVARNGAGVETTG